jgi:hypothetical protein
VGAVVVGVGGADVDELLVQGGDRPDHAIVAGRTEEDGVLKGEVALADHDVGALGRTQEALVDPAFEETHPVRPGAGAVDHLASRDRAFLAGQEVGHVDAPNAPALLPEAPNLHVVGRHRPGLGRALEGVDGEPGIVREEVVIPAPADQLVGVEVGLPP